MLNMSSTFRINYLTSQAKAVKVDDLGLVSQAHHNFARRDVSMGDALAMKHIQTINHLIKYHQRCLERESAATKIEQVLNTRSEQTDHCVEAIIFEND